MTTRDTYDLKQAELLDSFERMKEVWQETAKQHAAIQVSFWKELEDFKAWWELEKISSLPEA